MEILNEVFPCLVVAPKGTVHIVRFPTEAQVSPFLGPTGWEKDGPSPSRSWPGGASPALCVLMLFPQSCLLLCLLLWKVPRELWLMPGGAQTAGLQSLL